VAVSFDLEARKIVPLDDDAKARLTQRITPGLSI
jgi:hypothetical protein